MGIYELTPQSVGGATGDVSKAYPLMHSSASHSAAATALEYNSAVAQVAQISTRPAHALSLPWRGKC